ncbi:MAG: AAA family ATPase [Hyphomicrobiales bacterium]|nr:AAA family ATPase [Hyphomicrobiales bacterium]
MTDRFILPQSSQRLLMQKELGRAPIETEYLDHADILRFLRKYFLTLALSAVLGGAAAVAYVVTTPPTYTARAQLLIDPTVAQAPRDTALASDSTLDAPRVEGQMAVLRSETIAQRVIEQLDLLNTSDFKGDPPGFFKRRVDDLRRLLMGAPPEGPPDNFIQMRVAVAQFQGSLDVRRVGQSYAVDIAYSSRDPELAARVANAVADAYVQDQIRTKTEAAKQSAAWLEQRIEELRGQFSDAARDVQLFKSGQNLAPSVAPPPDLRTAPVTAPPAVLRPPYTPGPPLAQPPALAQPLVTLAELESRAQNYKKVYETYLQALTETVQKQSFSVANARIITPATRPLVKSHPKSKLIAVLGVLTGSLLGLGLAFLRHSMDNSVRSAKQVRDLLGLTCLSLIPRLTKPKTLGKDDPLAAEQMFREVAIAPFSPFSGSMKKLRTAVVNAGGKTPMRVVGVTSALPGEGKTTISGNLALLFSMSKSRVLLVDADIHHATISQAFAPNATVGLLELLRGDAPLHKTVVSGQGRGPDVLPLALKGTPAPSYEMLGSAKMRDALTLLKQTYDFVIIDMPPLRPVVDGLSISSLLDGVLLVAEWGETPLDILEDVAAGLYTAQAEVIGVVLSKVDPSLVSIPWRKQSAYNYAAYAN